MDKRFPVLRHRGVQDCLILFFALFQCAPWKDRSCCTTEVTQDMHISPTWYSMDWSHCPTPLSTPCQKHFMQDLCFYECSPNVGPWLVPVSIWVKNPYHSNNNNTQFLCSALSTPNGRLKALSIFPTRYLELRVEV